MYLLPHNPRSPTLASSADEASKVVLLGRQATTTIVSTAPPPANCAGQYSGGALAGAILGTFFGTILLIYLFSVIKTSAFTKGGSTEVVVEKRRRHRSSTHT